MKNVIIALCIAAATAIAGCGKDGDTGPQGEQGPQGPAGTNGTNGVNGTNGTNGNANVKLFMFGPTTFTSTSTSENYDINKLFVPQNMMDSSMTLVYVNHAGYWVPVPGSYSTVPSFQLNYTISSVTTVSPFIQNWHRFCITIFDSDFSPYSSVNRTFDKTKILIVPASNYTGNRHSGVNFNNYEATMKHFGLPLD